MVGITNLQSSEVELHPIQTASSLSFALKSLKCTLNVQNG